MNTDKPRFLLIDIETTGLGWNAEILTVAAAYRDSSGLITSEAWIVSPTLCDSFVMDGNAFQLAVPDSIFAIRDRLQSLAGMADMIAFHNGAFDIPYLIRDGIIDEPMIRRKLFDTMLAARLTGPHVSHSLQALLAEYEITPATHDDLAFYERMKRQRGSLIKTDRKGVRVVPTDDIVRYNKLDCELNLQLAEKLWKLSLQPTDWDHSYSLQDVIRWHDFVRVVSMMRVTGQRVDMDALVQQLQNIGGKLRDERHNIYTLSGKLVESEDHGRGLARYFKDRPWFADVARRSDKGAVTFDKVAVAHYQTAAEVAQDADALSILRSVQSCRHNNKIYARINEIMDAADAQDRVHGGFKVGSTVTFRMASSNPNVQNLPRDLPVWAPYVGCDYSQAELRLAAIIANSEALQNAYGAGIDVHQQTADRMFADNPPRDGIAPRHVAKQVNFLSLYGGGAGRLRDRLAEDQVYISMDEAQAYKSAHRDVYPAIYDMMGLASQVWSRRGYIRLWDGARIYLQEMDVRFDRAYKAFNNTIQGGIARMVDRAMHILHDEGLPIVGQVHDEIRFDPIIEGDEKALAIIREVMETALPEEWRNIASPPMQMKVDIEYKGNREKEPAHA